MARKTHLSWNSVIFTFFLMIGIAVPDDQTVIKTQKDLREGESSLNSCNPEASLMYKGTCISCLNANTFTKNETDIGNNGYQCPTVPLSLKKAKMKEGKLYLNGKNLDLITVIRQPFVQTKNDKFVGVVIEVLDALQKKHNFSRTIHLRKDGNWGMDLKNGSWSGMIGQVNNGEVDMGITGFSIIYARSKVIDFSVAFHQEPTAILMPAPKAGNKLTILIRPFRFEVWLFIFATIFVLGPSLWVFHTVSLRIRRLQTNPRGELLCDVFQFIIGSLVQEGMKSPVEKTTKFVVILWWFFTLIVANIYTSYIVSLLSVPKLYDFIDDLEGLVNQRELRWSYRADTATASLFNTSTSGVYQKVKLGTIPGDLVTNDQAGLDKVLTGKYVFLKEKSYLDFRLSEDFIQTNNTCRMTIAKEKFFTVGFAFILQKGSKYLELINSEIGISVTTGLMQKWKDMHWPKHLECENAVSYIMQTQPKTRKLNFDDVQGVNFLLACGLSFASMAFLGELIKHRFCDERRGVGIRRSSVIRRPHFSRKGQLDNVVKEESFGNYKIIMIPVKEEYFEKMKSARNQSNRKCSQSHSFRAC